MRSYLKQKLFGKGPQPHRIWFGLAKGCNMIIDPAAKTQRIVGLDERELHGVLRRLFKNSRTLIDVGASDGYYPIIAMRLNPHIGVIACDYNDELKLLADSNYRLNFPQGGPKLEWISTPIGKGAGQVPLDDLARGREGPILIKVDVDGYEIDVLQSGLGTLARKDCAVVVEVHSAELETGCIELLTSQGFRCTIIKNGWYRAIVPENRPIALNRWVLAEK